MINRCMALTFKGGATVLKVGGGNFASGAPHFLARGDKILLR